ncbi:hypothetical protein ACLD9I_004690 [Pseudomonas aeruginosa]
MARTIQDYVESAFAAFEAGFTSKAGQKSATDYLNRATDLLKQEVHSLCHGLRGEAGYSAREAALEKAYWMNLDLHLWGEKRRDELLGYLPEASSVADQFDDLAALRAAIKAAPVIKGVRQADERVERVQKSIRELMEMRKEQYTRGLQLHDLFGGLPVHANVHLVTNQHGTTFLRAFYFMDGVMTPLNVILAVLQTKALECSA